LEQESNSFPFNFSIDSNVSKLKEGVVRRVGSPVPTVPGKPAFMIECLLFKDEKHVVSITNSPCRGVSNEAHVVYR
jgi:hypothetical protein